MPQQIVEKIKSQWVKGIKFPYDGYLVNPGKTKINWLVSSDDKGRRCIIMNMKKKHSLGSSNAIEITCLADVHKKYNIVMSLLDNGLEDIFVLVIADMLSASMKGNTEDEEFSLLSTRYKEWQKLLERSADKTLSLEDQKGLIGELYHIHECITEYNMVPVTVIEAWTGPEQKPQDFIFADSWHEVKTVGQAADSIKISSKEQLDGINRGELVVNFLADASKEDEKAITLNSMVAIVEDDLSEDTEALFSLNKKLLMRDYTGKKSEYDDKHYHVIRTAHYDIREDFPRIKKDDVPEAIIKVSYNLSLAAIANWRK